VILHLAGTQQKEDFCFIAQESKWGFNLSVFVTDVSPETDYKWRYKLNVEQLRSFEEKCLSSY